MVYAAQNIEQVQLGWRHLFFITLSIAGVLRKNC